MQLAYSLQRLYISSSNSYNFFNSRKLALGKDILHPIERQYRSSQANPSIYCAVASETGAHKYIDNLGHI